MSPKSSSLDILWRQEPPDKPGWWLMMTPSPITIDVFEITAMDIHYGHWKWTNLWAGPIKLPSPPEKQTP